jgi:ATP-dependent Lhr-like helicase
MTINFIKGPPPPEEETMKNLRPYVAQWFKEKFGEMTPPQTYAIPLIHENKSTLIISPIRLCNLLPLENWAVSPLVWS